MPIKQTKATVDKELFYEQPKYKSIKNRFYPSEWTLPRRKSPRFKTNIGRKKNIPTTDITNPPIVPAANGNQKASLSVPIINGTNPRIVETTVRKMGTIFAFHALV